MQSLFFLVALLATPTAAGTRYTVVDQRNGAKSEILIEALPRAESDINPGPRAPGPIALPTSGPDLPAINTLSSPLIRARDVLPVDRYPARAVAKLFRILPDGQEAAQACTASFVGARHLITARHCVIRSEAGPSAGRFEIAAQYDDGAPSRSGWVAVERIWFHTETPHDGVAANQLVTPTRCSDFAILEIGEPLGERLGWLGLGSTAMSGTGQPLLYRFSYPHQNSGDAIEASLASQPNISVANRNLVLAEAARRRRSEPPFDPSSLHFEYGVPDRVEPAFVADRTGYVLPGRSGSALINRDGEIVAILSRAYEGVTYSCRLTPQIIGEISAILRASVG